MQRFAIGVQQLPLLNLTRADHGLSVDSYEPTHLSPFHPTKTYKLLERNLHIAASNNPNAPPSIAVELWAKIQGRPCSTPFYCHIDELSLTKEVRCFALLIRQNAIAAVTLIMDVHYGGE